jgi:hypothetical protein
MSTETDQKAPTVPEEISGLMKVGTIAKAHFEYLKAVGVPDKDSDITLERLRSTIKRLGRIRDEADRARKK